MRNPIFLSVVLVLRNDAEHIRQVLVKATEAVRDIVAEYELVVVDNASEDNSVSMLQQLTAETGLPNIQAFALTKEVSSDTAAWVGLEHALGDFVAVIDPLVDDIGFLPEMIDRAVGGADVVFATNQQTSGQSLAYRICSSAFQAAYKWFAGVNLTTDAPGYRLLNRRVANFILQHPSPAISYRHLPATGGFARVNLTYSAHPTHSRKKHLKDSIDRGARLIVSTTRAPMRLVTVLSVFGAVSNVVYSAYVIVIALLKKDVAAGWVTLSLQQSGMFFLISLVLLILGEYILQMASLSNEGPPYHVAREFTSSVMTRHSKLNVEVEQAATPIAVPASFSRPG
jgi:glycosyltransferase involved in cell wall biosynthesis